MLVVLCADEKFGVQARGLTELLCVPELLQNRETDYVGHGTNNLSGASVVAAGEFTGECKASAA